MNDPAWKIFVSEWMIGVMTIVATTFCIVVAFSLAAAILCAALVSLMKVYTAYGAVTTSIVIAATAMILGPAVPAARAVWLYRQGRFVPEDQDDRS